MTTPEKTRSFALVGHGHAGKTSLADALARLTGQNTRLGAVIDHSSMFDTEPEEQKRMGSITSAFLSCDFDGYRVHVADTPGDSNFLHDAELVMQAVDGAILVVSAVDGVEVNTERMDSEAQRMGIPRAVFINKMDRERANADKALADVAEALDCRPVALQVPIGVEDGFKGIVDLINHKAYVYDGDSGSAKEVPIPADLADIVAEATEAMTEAVAETDDALIEKYLDEGELSAEDVRAGLNRGILSGAIVPVLFGSATKNIGVDRLLWFARALPTPMQRPAPESHTEDLEPVELSGDPDAPFAALCFKTIIDPFSGAISMFRVFSGTADNTTHPRNARTGKDERFGHLFFMTGKEHQGVDSVGPGDIFGVAKLKGTRTGDTLSTWNGGLTITSFEPPPPMISYVVKPRSRGDEDKVKTALEKTLLEDPGLHQGFDEVTKEIVLSGMGQQHIAIACDRMARKYNVSVDLGLPTIPYRETIQSTADVRYRHKKQSGGAGQFGEVAIRIEPNPGAGFEFVNKTVGGVIPHTLIPSVEKGVRKKLEEGILAGFPVIDIRVTVYDGKTHPVDSKDIAFQIAGRQAVKKAVLQARPVLLEPIYLLAVVAPEESVGDIMGDLNSRRGRIQNMDTKGRNSVINALVPLAEILSYAPDLKSMTAGKGSYTMRLSSYEAVPASMLEKTIEDVKRLRDEED